MTLEELERAYAASAEAPPDVLARLRDDPRAGARRLYRRIHRRMEARQRERDRLDALFRIERELWAAGVERVAGVDEVGIGPMAGPVVAAAVICPPGVRVEGVDDSKRLDPETREMLDGRIRAAAVGVGVGVVESGQVDRLNVYHAGLRAMRLAVESLPRVPEHVLVDGRTIPGIVPPQSGIPRGDAASFSIAAASIVAKVFRDRRMRELDTRYPGYGFAIHKGYCTPAHQEAVRRLGPSPIHRRSFAFMDQILGRSSPAFYELIELAGRVASPGDVERLEEGIAHRAGDLAPTERRKLASIARRRRKRFSS